MSTVTDPHLDPAAYAEFFKPRNTAELASSGRVQTDLTMDLHCESLDRFVAELAEHKKALADHAVHCIARHLKDKNQLELELSARDGNMRIIHLHPFPGVEFDGEVLSAASSQKLSAFFTALRTKLQELGLELALKP